MHSNPLHYPIKVECLCCHVEQEFIFKSHSDQIVCKSCLRHQGNTVTKANLRDSDHIGLWRSELVIANEDHVDELTRLKGAIEQRDHEITRQRAEIEDLKETIRAGVESAPLAAVEKWFASEQVASAMSQRDSSYRSRDHAYRVLWTIHRLHHEDESRSGFCSCGQRTERCEEFDALTPVINELSKWENTQIERLKRGLPDGLPNQHPEVLRFGHRHRRNSRGQVG